MLEIRNLNVSYGRVGVIHEVSLSVGKGEIVCIVGANGAGKPTLLNTISGFNRHKRDAILFEGKPLPGDPTKVTSEKIVQVPEGRRIFPNISVYENLLLGGYKTKNSRIAPLANEIYGLFPVLGQRQKQRAGTLSGGEQQMLAIGRGLMAQPKIMLLDEPSLGLAPLVVKDIFTFLKARNRKTGLSMLLVEQNAKVALGISDRAYILENGRIALEGAAQELLENERMIEAYFGGKKS